MFFLQYVLMCRLQNTQTSAVAAFALVRDISSIFGVKKRAFDLTPISLSLYKIICEDLYSPSSSDFHLILDFTFHPRVYKMKC